MKICAITLDLDDTLWPVAATIHGAEAALLRHLQTVAPNTAARFNREAMMVWRKSVSAAHPSRKTDLSFLRKEIIRLALSEHHDDPNLAEGAFEVFFEARQQVKLFDDALPALERLAAKVPIVALSNGNADIKKIGIDHFFVGRVTSSTLPEVKPHLKVFEYAVGLAKASLIDTLHVGDDVALDVLGAHRAGMKTAWIHRESQSWEEAEQHQAKLHASWGLNVDPARLAQAHERPDYICTNLLSLVDALETDSWL
jgi:FMN hydrolase / 5-amino-6-(5-phospho-D-ribitylamino)uracil phosphatase